MKAIARLRALGLSVGLALALAACGANTTDDIAAIEGAEGAPVEAASLYETNCATCHNGTVEQAPRREALAALTSERILAAMDTGIMQLQSAMLSQDQRSSVANYLSEVTTVGEQAAFAGYCETDAERSLASQPVRVADWGLDPQNTRNFGSDLTRINATNAASLELDWVFAFPNAARARVQPTLAGDTLYTADQNGNIYALAIDTGCIRWTAKTDAEIRSALVVGSDAQGNADTLYFGDLVGGVHALDIATRSIVWSTRADEHLATRITGTLRLHGERLFVPVSSLEVVSARDDAYECCTFRGSVVALDESTGRKIWQTYTVPPAVKQGLNRVGTQLYAPSGAPVWTSPAIDASRGLLYVGTGENYTRPTSGHSDSILALSLEDGSMAWSFQALAEDAWNAACVGGANCPADTGPDYDFGASPIITSTPDGRGLVLAGQKSGWVYALDPDRDGEVVWKRKVGRGGIMGGVHWGMALQGETLFVPIADGSVYAADAHLPAKSGMHALEAASGEVLWSHLLEDRCGDVDWVCSPAMSAAASAAPGIIAGGSLDGMMRVFAADDGAELWSFDTHRPFEAVNSATAEGGAIESDGPVFGERQMFVTSGYDSFNQISGNVLLAFRLPESEGSQQGTR